MFEKVVLDGVVYAILIRRDFQEPGIRFFTPPELSQQLGHMLHPAGHRIAPHVHREVSRHVRRTEEALFIRRGVLRVDFYDDARAHVGSRTLTAGDVILLLQGGHGFEVLEECDMVEVKQGPYAGDADKECFVPSSANGPRR